MTLALSEFLSDVRTGSHVVPRFQREFVWEPAAICKLIDSIARRFPVGALLTLPTERLFLSSQPLDYEGSRTALVVTGSEPQRACYYLLDGQQRVTSISRAMIQNADARYQYFFDLDAIYAEIYEQDTSNDSWVISRRRPKSGRRVPGSDTLLRCDEALDNGITTLRVMSYLKHKLTDYDPSDEKQSALLSGMLNVLETVRNYQIIIHQMDREPLEAVCRIFETINNTGVKLDTFDLVVAKNYSPKYNLRDELELVRETYPKTASVSGEAFLHAIMFKSQMLVGKRPELSRAGLLLADGALWSQENLLAAGQAYTRVVDWMTEQSLRLSGRDDLIPLGMQTVLAACEMLYPGSLQLQVVGAHLKRWVLAQLWTINMYNKASSISDLLVLKHYFEAVRRREPAQLPMPSMGRITASEVLEASSASRAYRILMAIVVADLTRDIMGGIIGPDTVLEDHHILPRSVCDLHGIPKSARDSFANRILVTKISNSQLIRDALPNNYFQDAVRVCGEAEAIRNFEASLISQEFLEQATLARVSEFMELLEGRATRVAVRANEFFGLT